MDELGRHLEAESSEDLGLAAGGLGALLDGTGGTAEGPEVHLLEFVVEVALRNSGHTRSPDSRSVGP